MKSWRTFPMCRAFPSGRSAPCGSGFPRALSLSCSFGFRAFALHSYASLRNSFAAPTILNAKLQGLVSKEFQQLNILCFIRLRKTIAINTEILRFAKSIALYLRNFLFRYFWNTQNQQEPYVLHLRQQKKANLLYLRH